EDASRSLRDTAIGVAVAHVDERIESREVGALAVLAADIADRLLAEDRAPSLRLRIEPVRDHVELDPLPCENRGDELVEAARDDERAAEAGELSETGADSDVLANPRHDLGEWRVHGLELERDDVPKAEGVPKRRL